MFMDYSNTKKRIRHTNDCGRTFEIPPWFKFGVSSSAYQVEGAWYLDGKGESKWDRLTHRYPEKIRNGVNANSACTSYHQWKRDIEMIEEMNVQVYRFSVSWPRILPNGFPCHKDINKMGTDYYNSLIDELLNRDIEPVITLYHGDMPQTLRDLGGWANPQIIEWFTEYARLVFNLYGDRVKTWITINDPLVECDSYYGEILAPELDYFVGPYICSKNILLAHANAWHSYNDEFRKTQNGTVSIANHLIWLLPFADQDKELTESARQFITGRFTHPIYSEKGGWPPVVAKIIANNTNGFSESRLPDFTSDEINLIKGTYDFFAMNHYSTRLVRRPNPGENITKSIYTYVRDLDAVLVGDPSWTYGYSNVKAVFPLGIRMQMNWLKTQYGDLEFLITENGYSNKGSNLNDDNRISFIRGYLGQVLQALNEQINVTGYTYTSLMDSFEWTHGYEPKFGLYEVNFAQHNRERSPRLSSVYYSNIIRKRTLFVPVPCEETTT